MELAWHGEPDEPLPTAGAPRLVPRLEGSFVAMNGDNVTTLDHRGLLAHHRKSGAGLTIAAQAKRVHVEFSVMELDGDRVIGYRVKPTLEYDVSMGIHEARVVEHLPDGPCQFAQLVQQLLDAGEHVCAHRSDAAW